MKHTAKSFLCLLLTVFILAGCTPAGDPQGSCEPSTDAPVDPMIAFEERLAGYAQLGTSPDDNYRTWYEIFVYSYCDSNGDGIGDINGVRSKLDELEALGVTGIWLMPIHPSNSYHKYDVNDYYAIDPSYGSLTDFEGLLAECKERGIKVIMDLVVNHSGTQVEWFQMATEYLRGLMWGDIPTEEDCEYYGYYNFSMEAKTGYTRVSGTDFYYESQFSSGMPDLNLANEQLRAEIANIMKYWMDMGVAGFRVDAAKEFYSGQIDKNIEVLNWLQTTATSINPDAYMVAEVWDDFGTMNQYYKSGFTSIFNYPFGNSGGKLIMTVRNVDNPNMVPSYAKALQTAHETYAGHNPNYIDAPFLSNHDVGRIYGFASGDINKIKLAGAMNVFMSGSVFIYYGEEIAMPGSGNDPSKRAPMYWNAERNNGTTNLPPDCKLPEEYPMGSLAEQKGDPNSVYNFYREIIAIRNALPVISHGAITEEVALNVGCISAQRKTWGDQECLILMNVSTEAAQVDMSAYADWGLTVGLSIDGNPVTLDGSTLNMAAYGIAILMPNK